MANSGASQPKGTPTLQRSTSASINQQSILGFFQKKTADLPTRTAIQQPSPQANTRLAKRAPTIYKNAGQGPTPAPSSDIVDPADSPLSDNAGSSKRQRAVNYADMDDGAEEVPSRPITSRRKGSKRRRILDEHESDEYAEEGAVQSEDGTLLQFCLIIVLYSAPFLSLESLFGIRTGTDINWNDQLQEPRVCS